MSNVVASIANPVRSFLGDPSWQGVKMVLAIGVAVSMICLSVNLPAGYYEVHSRMLFVQGEYDEQIDPTLKQRIWVKNRHRPMFTPPSGVENIASQEIP
jgi:hypothetical protein